MKKKEKLKEREIKKERDSVCVCWNWDKREINWKRKIYPEGERSGARNGGERER